MSQLFDDEWESRVKADPIFATFIGDSRFNDRLPLMGLGIGKYLGALAG